MPLLIDHPTRIEAAGNKPKLIDEYIGRVNSGDGKASIAHMRSPGGWVEPGQTPEFDEFTDRVARPAPGATSRRCPGRAGGAGRRGARRRMGAIQHAGNGRRRILRYLCPGVFAGHSSPRPELTGHWNSWFDVDPFRLD